jgi:hypothetical protein
MVSSPLNEVSSAGLTIDFVTDSLALVSRPGTVTDSLRYSIITAPNDPVYFTLSIPVAELGGQLYLCDHTLVASYATLDGLTTVFKRLR